MSWRGVLLVSCGVALGVGCTRPSDATPPRGVGGRTETPEFVPPAAPVAATGIGRPTPASSDPYQPPRRGREDLEPTTVPTTITVDRPATPSTPGTPAPPEAPAPRDPSAELRNMMGSPGSCAPASALEHVGATVSLSIRVTTMPSGTIARASVSGAGLPSEVTTCLEQRAMGLRFTPPVEGAPVSVTTTIVLERRAIAP